MARRARATLRAVNLHTTHAALPGASIGTAPEWIMLVPGGTFTGEDGRGPYTLADPAAVIAASMRDADAKLAIDENHSTDFAARTGGSAPARGWIVELQPREGALWGRVDWTPAGRELMADGGYRGISPVFETDRKGVVLRVLRAALTNNPNLGDLPTLHTQEPGMDIAKLRAALGLPETADEAATLAAAAAGHAAVTRHAAETARIAEAAGVTLKQGEDLVTVLAARRSAVDGAQTDVARMSKELVEVHTQLATIRNERAQERAVAAVDGAVKAGKVIPGALRDHYVARHMKDAESVEKELAGMPSLHAGGMTAAHTLGGDDAEAMSAIDMETCKKMGLDPKAFAKHKKEAREAKMAEMDGGAA